MLSPHILYLRNIVFAVLAVSILTSCQIGSDVEIATVEGITVFVVKVNSNSPICVNGISVSEGNGELGRVDKWTLNQNDSDAAAGKSDCDNIFIFGKTHKGYQQTYDGKPLEVGKTYYVSFSGPGFGEGKAFTVAK